MTGIVLSFVGTRGVSSPGAPTVGTATSTGSTTATVAFTQPASNGGSVITSYTATSSPGGITGTLSQAGSGTITVSGLSPATAYTFTVTATNAVGTSPPSAASNSITTSPPAVGAAFGGGYYVGQISTAGTGVADYYLVVAPLSTGQSSLQFATSSGSDPTSMIDGPANSSTMNNASHPAAQFCEGLTIGGYSDWYMPARNELEVQYYFLKPTTQSNAGGQGSNPNAVSPEPISTAYTSGSPAQTSASNFRSGGGEAFSSVSYWCSTQASTAKAYVCNFASGYQGSYYGGKTGSQNVRAIRRIAV